MLHAVQAHFIPALRPALAPAIAVLAGPAAEPVPSDTSARVIVTATRLALVFPAGDDDPSASRGLVQFGAVHRWSGDGKTREFQVPDGLTGEVAELECPPGRPLVRGDDYAVDGRTLRLLRAPPVGQHNLLLRLRGGPARGYLDRRACAITLVVQVLSSDPAELAALSARVLAALLVAAAELPQLEAAPQDDLGVRLRLLRPVLSWLGSTRAAVPTGQTLLLRDTLEFALRGELEQRVVLGQPAPVGVIEKIVYTPTP